MIRQRIIDVAAVTGLRVAVVLTTPLFVAVARTRRGRLLGAAAAAPVAAVAVMASAVAVLVVFNPPEPVVLDPTPAGVVGALGVFAAWLLVAAAVILWPVVYLTFLPFRADPGGRVGSVFLGPVWPRGWQLALPPEQDALWLGASLVTRTDPGTTRAGDRRVRDGVRALLDDMAEYPDYRLLAPALPLAVWGSPFRPDHGHHFCYVPPHVPGERLGLLVGLHGHGGNSKLWLHAWRSFADDSRFAVVCPSFGYGNWEHPASTAAVGRCLDFALSHYPVDASRVVLAGLSQGGAGVGRAAAALPGRFAGLILLSPTIEQKVLDSPAFVGGWRGRPVLVIQGGRDRNVRPGPVTAAVGRMRAAGIAVTYHLDAEADHFLFFADLARTHRRVARLAPARHYDYPDGGNSWSVVAGGSTLPSRP